MGTSPCFGQGPRTRKRSKDSIYRAPTSAAGEAAWPLELPFAGGNGPAGQRESLSCGGSQANLSGVAYGWSAVWG